MKPFKEEEEKPENQPWNSSDFLNFVVFSICNDKYYV